MNGEKKRGRNTPKKIHLKGEPVRVSWKKRKERLHLSLLNDEERAPRGGLVKDEERTSIWKGDGDKKMKA